MLSKLVSLLSALRLVDKHDQSLSVTNTGALALITAFLHSPSWIELAALLVVLVGRFANRWLHERQTIRDAELAKVEAQAQISANADTDQLKQELTALSKDVRELNRIAGYRA